MTIGRSSKKVSRSQSFLERANGFYGRLNENEGELSNKEEKTEELPANKPEAVEGQIKEVSADSGFLDEQDCVGFDFNQYIMEDDGATLLERKPNRWSRRWSRMSSRRTKTDKVTPKSQGQSTCIETEVPTSGNKNLHMAVQTQPAVEPKKGVAEPNLLALAAGEEIDDQVIFSEKKDRLMETEKKSRKGEMEENANGVNMKVAKRSGLRSHSKVLDRALRRGWETFVANLYSVTLTPVSTSSPSPTKSSMDRKSALIDYR